jgi:hypothetical protein
MSAKLYNYPIKLREYLIDLIYFDLVRLILFDSVNRERYFIYAYCNKTKFRLAKPLKNKSEAFKFFLKFKAAYKQVG